MTKEPKTSAEAAIGEMKALRAEMQLLREAILELEGETGQAMPMRIVLLQGRSNFSWFVVGSGVGLLMGGRR